MERPVSDETKRAPRSGPNQASPRTGGMSSSDEEDERLADDGPLDASDKRVRWLAEKVSAGLGCDVDLFASCVANDDETRDRVEAFVRGALLRHLGFPDEFRPNGTRDAPASARSTARADA